MARAVAESDVARRAKRHKIGFPAEAHILGGCDLLLKHSHTLRPLSKMRTSSPAENPAEVAPMSLPYSFYYKRRIMSLR